MNVHRFLPVTLILDLFAAHPAFALDWEIERNFRYFLYASDVASQRVARDLEETLTFYRLPRQHHKHLKSTNMLERLSEEIRRRTYVVRIFPNAEACLRLVRALAVETHENWLEAHRYLNMNDLKEHKKTHLRQAA